MGPSSQPLYVEPAIMNYVVRRFGCTLQDASLFCDGEYQFDWCGVWLFSIERYTFEPTMPLSMSRTHKDTSAETSRSVRVNSLAILLSGQLLASWVRDLQSGACVKKLTICCHRLKHVKKGCSVVVEYFMIEACYKWVNAIATLPSDYYGVMTVTGIQKLM